MKDTIERYGHSCSTLSFLQLEQNLTALHLISHGLDKILYLFCRCYQALTTTFFHTTSGMAKWWPWSKFFMDPGNSYQILIKVSCTCLLSVSLIRNSIEWTTFLIFVPKYAYLAHLICSNIIYTTFVDSRIPVSELSSVLNMVPWSFYLATQIDCHSPPTQMPFCVL